MEANCREEVVQLHRFFEAWMGGRLAGGEAFGRLEHALAPGFEMVIPAGRRLDRQSVLDGVRSARGVHSASEPPFRIWIEACEARALDGDWFLVGYEEWQELAGEVTARLSTALMRRDEGAQNGVSWHHVHETWRAG